MRILSASVCLCVLGCHGSSAQSASPLDAGSELDGSSGGACTSSGRVTCDGSKLPSLASAQPVTVVAGTGDPPAASGGAVAPGSYRLVSAALYGTPEPDVAVPHVGDRLVAVLDANCDVYNEVHGAPGATGAGGNGCGRLVPQSVSLAALVGSADAGEASQDTPYTATSQTLTLIRVMPYQDHAAGLTLGSYTLVEEFALVSADIDASVAGGDGGSSQPPAAAHDSRCPAQPPSGGEACDPRPTPLECEYGGDAFGRCTTFAACALGPDGKFAFVVDAAQTCAPNAAACPASFAKGIIDGAPAGGCTGPLVCTYDDGVCGCGSVSSASTWACRPRVQVSSDNPGCPDKRPLVSDGCSPEGLRCPYDNACAPDISLGPSLICENGHWERLGDVVNCPAKTQ